MKRQEFAIAVLRLRCGECEVLSSSERPCLPARVYETCHIDSDPDASECAVSARNAGDFKGYFEEQSRGTTGFPEEAPEKLSFSWRIPHGRNPSKSLADRRTATLLMWCCHCGLKVQVHCDEVSELRP